MDDATQKIVDKIQARIQSRDQQNMTDKKLVNTLCEIDGDPLIYTDLADQETSINAAVRGDQFFGRPMATVVKEILERRGQKLGAIPLNDLFNIMKAGGYDFKNEDDQIAKRNLAITIGKNPAFLKVPNNGHIGMAEWYPNAKKKAPRTNDAPDGDEQEIGTHLVNENRENRLHELAAQEAAEKEL